MRWPKWFIRFVYGDFVDRYGPDDWPYSISNTRQWVSIPRGQYERYWSIAGFELSERYGIELVRAKTSCGGRMVRLKVVDAVWRSKKETVTIVVRCFQDAWRYEEKFI